MIKQILIIILILFSSVRSEIVLPDSTLSSGDRILYPVLFNYIELRSDSTSIAVDVYYDPRMILIHEIIESEIDLNNSSISENGLIGKVRIEGDVLGDTIIFLDMEVLKSPLSESIISLDSNKTKAEVEIIDSLDGVISINDNIIYNQSNEAGIPFPNPFKTQLNVELNIKEPTLPEISLFDFNGAFVSGLNEANNINMTIENSFGSSVEGILGEGIYQLKLDFNSIYISDGVYFLYVRLGDFEKYFKVVKAN